MWFFRFAIILLEFLFIFYYTAVVFRIVSLFLLLVLLYRFIYLRRIRYRVGEEQLVSEHGICIRRVDSVSYTHLDVYKRQVL